jgi:probable F420-dependent oxidoreductase
MAQRLGIAVGLFGYQNFFGGDLAKATDFARMAEGEGIDGVSITDHVVMGPRTDRYPYGPFPVGPEWPWPEPMVVLAAIAAATERVRLSMSVLIAPLRPAVLLAKQAATLDVISGGRLDLGVGVGWQEEEYLASGIPFEKRLSRLTDQLRACRVLWSRQPASFASRTVSFRDVVQVPAPVQPGGIPIWLGIAAGDENCRRIAELGAGWVPISVDPGAIAPGVAKLRAALRAVGRDPSELGVRAGLRPVFSSAGRPELEATLAQVPAMREAGVTCIEMQPSVFCRERSDLVPFLRRIAKLGS